jgi:hypothetical protein
MRLLALSTAFCSFQALAQAPATRLNPAVKQVVDQVSQERISAIMKKLGDFGTRYVGSEQDSETRGIGAAQRWIEAQFKSYSPKLQVSLDKFTVKKNQRVPKDVDLVNIVAVLPGTTDRDRYVIIGGHYDSIASKRGPGTPNANDDGPRTAAEMEPNAPGVADDASGTAAVMELARIMSQYEYDKSIVFIAFAAEEIGLNGSKNYADEAKARNMVIEAMLNNDIIGSDGFALARHRPLRQGDRRALYAIDDGGYDLPPRPLQPRGRPYFIRPGRIRRRALHHPQRELRQSTYGHRHVCECVAGVCGASDQGQCSGVGEPGAGA